MIQNKNNIGLDQSPTGVWFAPISTDLFFFFSSSFLSCTKKGHRPFWQFMAPETVPFWQFMAPKINENLFGNLWRQK
jgi:hypothetical protein